MFALNSIVVSIAAVVLIDGFAESMYVGLRESMIRSRLGHIQVYRAGFTQYGAVYSSNLALSADVTTQIVDKLQTHKDVLMVTARLEGGGLITNGDKSLSANIIGINPEKEALVSSAIRITSGEELFSEDRYGVHVGEALAKALDITVGDELTILATTFDQMFNAIDIRVVGLVTTGVRDLDAHIFFGNIELVQDLFSTDAVTRVVVLLQDTSLTDTFFSWIKNQSESFATPIEVQRWSDLSPYYHEVVGLFNGIFFVIKTILVLVVAMSVAHALAMSVMERVREIGTLRAIGAGDDEIIYIFVLEGLLIGIIGSLAGLILGGVLADIISNSGLRMPTPPGATVDYPLRILITPFGLAVAFVLGVCVAVLSSLYPAVRATKLPIVEALHND